MTTTQPHNSGEQAHEQNITYARLYKVSSFLNELRAIAYPMLAQEAVAEQQPVAPLAPVVPIRREEIRPEVANAAINSTVQELDAHEQKVAAQVQRVREIHEAAA